MSSDFHFVFVLSFSFKFSIFLVSAAHDQKAHFLTSSVVTSQKWNLRFQIGQVLQFYGHYISAKYHTFRFNSVGRLFNWPPEGHVSLYQQNAYSKIFLESSIVACINFSVMPLKERKLEPQELQKCLCLSRPPTQSIFTTCFPSVKVSFLMLVSLCKHFTRGRKGLERIAYLTSLTKSYSVTLSTDSSIPSTTFPLESY